MLCYESRQALHMQKGFTAEEEWILSSHFSGCMQNMHLAVTNVERYRVMKTENLVSCLGQQTGFFILKIVPVKRL